MAIDFEKEGLLDGLDGDAREARLKLLKELEEEGVPLEELREAVKEGRLVLLPVERVLGGSARYTAPEVQEKTGLDRAFLDRLWRGMGFALPGDDERVFTEADLEAAQRAKEFLEAGIDEDGIVEISRTISRAMANVAASIGIVFTESFVRDDDDEYTLGRRYADASRELVPRLGPVLEHLLSVQQRNLIRQAAVDASELIEGAAMPGAQEISVCFADLVGFTKLGEGVDAASLGAVAERLEQMAADAAEGPVRLVKTIGDAAMLASRDNDALLEVAFRLVAAADDEGEGFPQLRAGVARGEALTRGGDWYGRPVNLASRITDVARPGSVLVSEEVKEAAKGDYSWSFAGARRLKGVDGEVKLYRARRATDAGD